MIAREKVIEGLAEIIDQEYEGWLTIPQYGIVRDALALLKEQEVVVKCKDCKHGEPGACGDGVDCDGVWHNDDWFCADGEQRG